MRINFNQLLKNSIIISLILCTLAIEESLAGIDLQLTSNKNEVAGGATFELKLTIQYDEKVDISFIESSPLYPFKLEDSAIHSTDQKGDKQAVQDNKIEYQYSLFVPTDIKSATYTIEPFTLFLVNGEQFKSNRLEIKVNNKAAKPIEADSIDQKSLPKATNSSKPTDDLPEAANSSKPTVDLLLSLNVSTDELLVSGYFILTSSFCHATALIKSPSVAKPILEGFFEIPMDVSSTFKKEKRIINDKEYNCSDRRFLLTPIILDENILIGPITHQVVTYDDPLTVTTLESNVVNIKVKPFPEEGKPAKFSGLIGNFNIAIIVENDRYPLYERIPVTITISGKGYLNNFELDKFEGSEYFKVLESKVKDKFILYDDYFVSTKEIKMELIGVKEGLATIKPFFINWFDPDEGQYKTDATREISIVLTKSMVTPDQQSDKLYSIPFISGDKKSLKNYKTFNFKLIWLKVALIILALLMIGALTLNKILQVYDFKDKTGKKKRDSLEAALTELELYKNSTDSFSPDAADRILQNFLADRFNLTKGKISKEQAADYLDSDESIADELALVMEQIEISLYSSDDYNITDLYNRLETIIRKIAKVT